jgi:hypothetical protein
MPELQGKILFCPFCRECFEAQPRCPHHDLDLVPFQELPRLADRHPYGEDESVPNWEWRLGRGWLWLSAGLMLVSFFLPLCRMTVGDASVEESAATIVFGGRATLLWSIPAVALALGHVPFWRRSPNSMLRLRVAITLLALFPIPAVAYSTILARRAIIAMTEPATFDLAYGAAVVLIASIVGGVGGFCFGRQPPPDA